MHHVSDFVLLPVDLCTIFKLGGAKITIAPPITAQIPKLIYPDFVLNLCYRMHHVSDFVLLPVVLCAIFKYAEKGKLWKKQILFA